MFRVCLFIICLASSVLTTSTAIQAQSSDPDEQLKTFAACVGRLSAVVEYEWSVSGAVSSETQQRRDAVVQIVAAIIPMDKSRDVLGWRNAAKDAQWHLLNRAHTAQDRAEGHWALQQAERFEQECTSLLTL